MKYLRFFTVTMFSAIFLAMASATAAHEGGIVLITCGEREMILDTDTARLDITEFRGGTWSRGVRFENGVSRISFQVITSNYIEGWGIDRETLMAVSHLQVLQQPDKERVDPVVTSAQCVKEDRELNNQI